MTAALAELRALLEAHRAACNAWRSARTSEIDDHNRALCDAEKVARDRIKDAAYSALPALLADRERLERERDCWFKLSSQNAKTCDAEAERRIAAEARAVKAEAERDEANALIKRMSAALREAAPLGGSESVIKHGKGYATDPEFAGERIRELRTHRHEAVKAKVAAEARAAAAEAELAEKAAEVERLRDTLRTLREGKECQQRDGMTTMEDWPWDEAQRIIDAALEPARAGRGMAEVVERVEAILLQVCEEIEDRPGAKTT